MNNQENLPKLDAKDREILRELDDNFRQSFSKIGKKVNLSKNSVALRYEKLKQYSLHNMVGINYELLNLTTVKVYYSFDYYSEELEESIINEVKKYPNVQWVSRYFGGYDIILCFLVSNLDDLSSQINKFDERFANKINRKEIQILFKQHFFRYNFLHDKPLSWVSKLEKSKTKQKLSNIDKNIIRDMLYVPRENVVDIARRLKISPKTVSNRVKFLEEAGIIMGYFMTIDSRKFNHDTFKLFVQLQNLKKGKEFEDSLSSLKNIKFFGKLLGMWDYEVDLICLNNLELQKQIESIKEKFPGLIKKVEVISFGRRLFTNKSGSFIQ